MRYLSVCSGIEAATVAWHPMGWIPAAFSEIEPFPRAVLQHHYPQVPLHGDFTTIKGDEYGAVELLVGGTPCQSFSIAGLRKGLDDPRGNLMLEYGSLARRLGAKWLVWENVPGVLSSNGGRDFGSFLGMLVQLGYGFAYRVLDAQYFGVAQRRRRVFVVACLGDWRTAASVLFERESLQRNFAPSREERKENTFGFIGGIDAELNFHGINEPTGTLIKGSPTGGGKPLPAIIIAPALRQWLNAGAMGRKDFETETLIVHGSRIRRLIPRECEKLQGFPVDYTLVPLPKKSRQTRQRYSADGPRYKALGNSMAVPVMEWIGKRIEIAERIKKVAYDA